MRASVLLIFSVAVAAGCSGGNNKVGPIDGATSQAAGDSLGDSSESSASGFGSSSGPTFAARAFAPGAAGGCATGSVTATPASPVDTDQDNVPDTVTFTFANCAVSSSNGTETLNGTVSIVDGTPTTADFDFVASHSLTIDLVGAGAHAGESASVSVTGSRTASGTAAGPTYSMTDATANDGMITKGAESHHVSDSKTWNLSYTPSGAWNPGGPLVAGSMSISGSWSVHVDDKGADAALTSSGITISPLCPTKIVAGSVTAAYAGQGGASTITVTWSGCGQRTVSYVGAS